jgi:hypothetical protein
MYNVKRIGVWKYETKMSRDWGGAAPPPRGRPPPGPGGAGPPPTLSHPLPIYLRYPLRVQFITNLGLRWTFLSQLEEAK